MPAVKSSMIVGESLHRMIPTTAIITSTLGKADIKKLYASKADSEKIQSAVILA